MRMLFLTPSPPRPDGGGAAIRNWHLVNAASRAGHRVSLATFVDDGHLPYGHGVSVTGARYPEKRTARERMRTLLVSRTPDLALRLRSEQLRSSVDSLMHDPRRGNTGTPDAPYDLIQVEGLEMWANLPTADAPSVGARLVPRPDDGLPPIIYDAHNAEAVLQERTMRQSLRSLRLPGAAYSLVQWRKLRAYERGVIQRAAATLAVSPADAAALERLAGQPVDVVPIGVDTARYCRDAPDLAPPVPYAVVFSGTLDYRPNTDAARWLLREIWPRVRAAKPDATLAIVGRNPPAALMGYDGTRGVTITGAVPDDRPYMAGAAVYALPVRFGAGVRVKLLNAMSMGGAVVATAMAAEGVAARHGEHLVTTPSRAGAFAAAVVALLDDPARRARLGAAARALMVARYDWPVVTPALLAVYARLEGRDG